MSCLWRPLPLWSESFYRDISTPLRHDHGIPEGRPRTVKLLQLLSPLLSCSPVRPYTSWEDCLSLFSEQFRIVSRTEGHVLFVFWMLKKQTTQLFSFYEVEQLKNMYAPCVDVTLHPISISAGELQHLPCMHPSYIHNSRSHPVSIWMSLSCTIHCTNPPSFRTSSSLMAFSL